MANVNVFRDYRLFDAGRKTILVRHSQAWVGDNILEFRLLSGNAGRSGVVNIAVANTDDLSRRITLGGAWHIGHPLVQVAFDAPSGNPV